MTLDWLLGLAHLIDEHLCISTLSLPINRYRALDWLLRLVCCIDQYLCVSTVVERCRNAEMLVDAESFESPPQGETPAENYSTIDLSS